MNINTPTRVDPMTVAAIIIGAAIVLILAVPHDVWAAAGAAPGADEANGSVPAGAKNLKKNGLGSLEQVGAVVFSVGAAWGLGRATFGGKVGQGMLQASISAVGFVVCLGPETVLKTVGKWATDLFVA